MDPTAAAIAGQFETGTNLFRKALRGVEREALVRRPGPRSNSMLWIAGHLTQFRYRVAGILGAEGELPWGAMFATGAKVGDAEGYPDGDEILARWDAITPELMRRLSALSVQKLAGPAPPRVASADGSLGGALAYLALHEGYHIGQLGFLRKWLGLSPLLDT